MAKGFFAVDVKSMKRAMVNKGLSGAELCKIARISPATLTNMMNGGRCYASTIGKIARALGVKGESLTDFSNGAA